MTLRSARLGRHLSLLSLLALGACAADSVHARVARTAAPAPKWSPADLGALATGSVVVLTPKPADDLLAPAYERVQRATEALLLDGGWRPVPPEPGGLARLEDASGVAYRLGARFGLLVRQLSYVFDPPAIRWARPDSACKWRAYVPVRVQLDLALIGADGAVLWSGLGSLGATDALPVEQLLFEYSYESSSNICAFKFPQPEIRDQHVATFCAAFNSDDGGDPREQCRDFRPPPEVIAGLAEATLPALLKPLLQLPTGDTSVHAQPTGDWRAPLAAAAAPVAPPAPALRLSAPVKIAVLPLRALAGVDASVTQLLTGQLLTGLDDVTNVTTVGQADLEAVLSLERERDLLACDKVSCMAELAGALGADRVLHGEVGAMGSRYAVNLSVVRTGDGTVLARVSRMTEADAGSLGAVVPGLIAELVDKLNKGR